MLSPFYAAVLEWSEQRPDTTPLQALKRLLGLGRPSRRAGSTRSEAARRARAPVERQNDAASHSQSQAWQLGPDGYV